MQKHRTDVGLEVHTGQVEREGPDTLRRRGTYARQRNELLRFAGKRAVIALHDFLRRPLERQRAAVVSHTLPRLEHIGGGGIGQRLDTRKALEPRRHARLDACHLGLLKHDLREPDMIGVARAAPWKVSVQPRTLGADERAKFL